jgi:hypothetical protein
MASGEQFADLFPIERRGVDLERHPSQTPYVWRHVETRVFEECALHCQADLDANG